MPGSRSRSMTSASGAGSSGARATLGNGKTAKIPWGVCTSLSRSKSRRSTTRAGTAAGSGRSRHDSGSSCRTSRRRGTAPVCRASWTARRPSTTNAPSAARRSRRARERTRAMAGLAAEVMTSFEGVSLRSGGATAFRGAGGFPPQGVSLRLGGEGGREYITAYSCLHPLSPRSGRHPLKERSDWHPLSRRRLPPTWRRVPASRCRRRR